MVCGEVLVVLILHVLFDNVLHLLRDDDNSYHPKPQRCLNHSSSFLHALEPLQRLHDPIQGTLLVKLTFSFSRNTYVLIDSTTEDSPVVEMVLLGKSSGMDTIRPIGVPVR